MHVYSTYEWGWIKKQWAMLFDKENFNTIKYCYNILSIGVYNENSIHCEEKNMSSVKAVDKEGAEKVSVSV